MIARARHLHDDRLFDCYTAARAGEPLDPRLAEHLAECAPCTARYTEMARLMDEIALQAAVDADAVFTPERLRAQQQQVARRIAHIGRPARVISFPRPASGDYLQPPRVTHARERWIAAAAAAGLFVGVALGTTLGRERRPQPSSALVEPTIVLPMASVAVAADDTGPVPETAADHSFLSDLDVSLDRPRFAGELQVFDVLTPHVRDIRNVR